MGPLNDPKTTTPRPAKQLFDVQDMALQTTGTEQDLSHIQTFGCTLSWKRVNRWKEGLMKGWLTIGFPG